jgi:hypothetical protein
MCDSQNLKPTAKRQTGIEVSERPGKFCSQLVDANAAAA